MRNFEPENNRSLIKTKGDGLVVFLNHPLENGIPTCYVFPVKKTQEKVAFEGFMFVNHILSVKLDMPLGVVGVVLRPVPMGEE